MSNCRFRAGSLAGTSSHSQLQAAGSIVLWMEAGEICARLYSDGRPVRLTWAKGFITSVEEQSSLDEEDLWLAPAMVDLQINGYAGVDFQQDGLTESDLLRAVRSLRQAGCGWFLLTLMTDRWDALITRLRRMVALRAGHEELRRAIVGWHLEGPFLSAEPGYAGAHDPSLMIDPTPSHMDQLRAVVGSDPVLVTLAPERSGAVPSIQRAVSLGFKVSLGHTNANDEVLRAALAAGATGFTHLANACPQLLDRHDNILWRVLDNPGLTVSFIPDGLHVAPRLFRLMHRVLRPEVIYYTTDAVAPAGAPPGRYSIGRNEVDVGPERIVRHPGQTNYAGSALEPIEGVRRAAAMLGLDWRQVWDGFSIRPAAFIGLTHRVEVGQPAAFCLLRVKPNQPPSVVRTVS